MATLRIEGEGSTATGYTLFLNGEDLSDSTRAVTLDMSVEDANTATLEVYVHNLELDAEVEAHLKTIDPLAPERTSWTSKFREWVGR